MTHKSVQLSLLAAFLNQSHFSF